MSIVDSCRVCSKALLSAGDRRLGVCFQCYKPHSSPLCRSGFCSIEWVKK